MVRECKRSCKQTYRVYILSPKCLMQAPLFLVILSKCPGISFKEIQKYSTFLLYLLIHNFISPVHHIYKPFLNIYYPIIKVYRSGQFECNCITDLSLNIQPTISLQPLTQYLYGVDRPAHMLSMINGFIVHIHGHVSRRPWLYQILLVSRVVRFSFFNLISYGNLFSSCMHFVNRR